MTARRHFGSVRKLPSGRWQGSYWHAGARHTAENTFPAKADALAWLSGVEADVHRGAWINPASGRMTVADLAARWLESNPAKRTSTRVRDEAIIRLHIVPTLGTIKLAEVTPPAIQALVNGWGPGHSPSTVGRQYDTLRACFAYAVALDWAVRTPCRGIKLPSVPVIVRRQVTPEAVETIAGAMDERYRPMVWLGAVLGLRWGEVAGLTVGALDLLRGTVSVSCQLGRDGLLGPPKSAAGRRDQTMPVPLVETLASHLATEGLTGADPDRLVFTAQAGTPLDYSHWRSRVWLPAVRTAGFAGATFHDLRRTNATLLVRHGVDLKTAQNRLGHSDPRLTLAVYAQVVTEADRAASDVLGDAFFGASRTQRARQGKVKGGPAGLNKA